MVTETDYKSLEFVKSKMQSIKERDLTIIIDTFNFFPLLNEGRDSIKEFVNLLYNFAKNNNAIIYLLSLRNTVDSKIEIEIMWQGKSTNRFFQGDCLGVLYCLKTEANTTNKR